jgi:hypothetical protein
LRRQVEDRLKAIAAEDLAPWCKLGNVVFRATEIEDRGNVIHVKARVRGDAVARAPEDMRGDKFNRGTVARITWSGRSKYAKVTGVHVTTTSGRSKMFCLELEAADGRQDRSWEMTINGKSPGDLTESALRTVLFGEPKPFADQYMGFANQSNILTARHQFLFAPRFANENTVVLPCCFKLASISSRSRGCRHADNVFGNHSLRSAQQ